jgi:hypothetical protein
MASADAIAKEDNLQVMDMGRHCLTDGSKPVGLKELQLVDVPRSFPPLRTYKVGDNALSRPACFPSAYIYCAQLEFLNISVPVPVVQNVTQSARLLVPCISSGFVVDYNEINFLQEKAVEATKQKKKKGGKNLSPRNRKACHSVDYNEYVMEDNGE